MKTKNHKKIKKSSNKKILLFLCLFLFLNLTLISTLVKAETTHYETIHSYMLSKNYHYQTSDTLHSIDNYYRLYVTFNFDMCDLYGSAAYQHTYGTADGNTYYYYSALVNPDESEYYIVQRNFVSKQSPAYTHMSYYPNETEGKIYTAKFASNSPNSYVEYRYRFPDEEFVSYDLVQSVLLDMSGTRGNLTVSDGNSDFTLSYDTLGYLYVNGVKTSITSKMLYVEYHEYKEKRTFSISDFYHDAIRYDVEIKPIFRTIFYLFVLQIYLDNVPDSVEILGSGIYTYDVPYDVFGINAKYTGSTRNLYSFDVISSDDSYTYKRNYESDYDKSILDIETDIYYTISDTQYHNEKLATYEFTKTNYLSPRDYFEIATDSSGNKYIRDNDNSTAETIDIRAYQYDLTIDNGSNTYIFKMSQEYKVEEITQNNTKVATMIMYDLNDYFKQFKVGFELYNDSNGVFGYPYVRYYDGTWDKDIWDYSKRYWFNESHTISVEYFETNSSWRLYVDYSLVKYFTYNMDIPLVHRIIMPISQYPIARWSFDSFGLYIIDPDAEGSANNNYLAGVQDVNTTRFPEYLYYELYNKTYDLWDERYTKYEEMNKKDFYIGLFDAKYQNFDLLSVDSDIFKTEAWLLYYNLTNIKFNFLDVAIFRYDQSYPPYITEHTDMSFYYLMDDLGEANPSRGVDLHFRMISEQNLTIENLEIKLNIYFSNLSSYSSMYRYTGTTEFNIDLNVSNFYDIDQLSHDLTTKYYKIVESTIDMRLTIQNNDNYKNISIFSILVRNEDALVSNVFQFEDIIQISRKITFNTLNYLNFSFYIKIYTDYANANISLTVSVIQQIKLQDLNYTPQTPIFLNNTILLGVNLIILFAIPIILTTKWKRDGFIIGLVFSAVVTLLTHMLDTSLSILILLISIIINIFYFKWKNKIGGVI